MGIFYIVGCIIAGFMGAGLSNLMFGPGPALRDIFAGATGGMCWMYLWFIILRLPDPFERTKQ